MIDRKPGTGPSKYDKMRKGDIKGWRWVDPETPWKTDEEIRKEQDEPGCLHKQCSDCHGSGRKENGQICAHMISCPCRRCNPTF